MRIPRNGKARRAWLLATLLAGSALLAGAGLARAEAPWWRLERALYKPLPPGTRIEIDTADPLSVQRARRLAGYMQMPEFPPEARGSYAAQCAKRPEGRYAGLFFDLISGETSPACADATPLSPDRAEALCGVLWQRRGALLAMKGLAQFEPPYTVASVRGSRVVCRVGGEA